MYKHPPEKKETPVSFEREYFNLDHPGDKQIILAFERELDQCNKRREQIFDKELCGFELLLYDKGFMVYNKNYPRGAVSGANLAGYRMAQSKMQAYGKLCDRREEQKKEDELKMQNLIKDK